MTSKRERIDVDFRRSVQITTNRAADQIGFRGNADLLLVISVGDDASWEQVYFGPFGPIKAASRFSSRDNKHMILIAKLRSLLLVSADTRLSDANRQAAPQSL